MWTPGRVVCMLPPTAQVLPALCQAGASPGPLGKSLQLVERGAGLKCRRDPAVAVGSHRPCSPSRNCPGPERGVVNTSRCCSPERSRSAGPGLGKCGVGVGERALHRSSDVLEAGNVSAQFSRSEHCFFSLLITLAHQFCPDYQHGGKSWALLCSPARGPGAQPGAQPVGHGAAVAGKGNMAGRRWKLWGLTDATSVRGSVPGHEGAYPHTSSTRVKQYGCTGCPAEI